VRGFAREALAELGTDAPPALATVLSTPDVAQHAVRLLPDAVKRLHQLRAAEQAANLRLQVNSGGCNGFQYEFRLENSPAIEDTVIEQDGAVLLVDKVSIDFLNGCEIDYEATMIRAGFKVARNDLADSACGCGSSFNVASF
jgi:iron-sulfur cluster assembly accessory protein